MSGSPRAAADDSPPQEVCIDLPGESVQCWRSGSKLKVVLRKHRDVIFDLKLGNGKSYTVESTVSDFYNATKKKLMLAKQKGVVTFKDGERTHLWIPRAFGGQLLLKCDNKLVMKIDPNQIDDQQYDDDPRTKPAPIIITLGTSSNVAPKAATKTSVATGPVAPIPRPASAPIDEDCPVVCIVEGSMKGIPESLYQHFAKGGGKLTGMADIDPNDVATRNWIWGQAAGTAAYVRDNWSWLKASIDSRTHQGFKLVSAKVRLVRGNVRFYFSGYSKFNSVFGPGGFGPGHDRILSIFSGAGKTSSSFAAISKGILGSVKGNSLLSFIFSSAAAVAEWKEDVSKDGYDLASALLIGLLKAIVAAASTVAIVAALIALFFAAFTASIVVVAVGAFTVGVGFLVNYGIDALDKKAGSALAGKESPDGLAGWLAPVLRSAGKEMANSWEHLMAKFPTDYKDIYYERP